MFHRKGVLKNFVNFTGKHVCQSLSCRREAWNFIKKEALAQLLSCEICEIYKSTFFIQHLRTTASDTKPTSTIATTEFLSKIRNRKKISNEHFKFCEAKISLDEIIKFINSETNNKYPCNDSLSTVFYKHFFLHGCCPFRCL